MSRPVALTTLLLAAACGGPERAPDDHARPSPTSAAPSRTGALAAALRFTPELERVIPGLGLSLLHQGLRARAGGHLAAPGARPGAYGDATEWQVELETVEPPAADAAAVLAADHVVELEAFGDDGSAIRLGSRRRGAEQRIFVRGRLVRDGAPYELDVTWTSTQQFDNDSTGAHQRSDTHVTGWAKGPDFDLEIAERARFELVSATGAFTAQSFERSVDGGVVIDGRAYGFVGLRTRRAFRDGKPTEIDTFWAAEGRILEDGQGWGHLELSPDIVAPGEGGYLQVVLHTPTGRIVLESFQAY